MHVCKYCGSRIQFCRKRKRPDGTLIYYKRPYPRHLDHPCTR